MISPDHQIGHYKIRSAIGKGGMGEVFLAEDVRLDRKVALKILPEEFAEDSERMRRFVQEAKAASALNHPNIITIYEIGEIDSTNFIATEFIEGETLHKQLEGQLLKLKSVLEISIQIISALDSAHRAGIVHRDIKPENVMIRPDGLVKLLDFGIAKLSEMPSTDSGLIPVTPETEVEPFNTADATDKTEAATVIKVQTNPGMIIGTANYMSPEQARGKKIDARTDIFSFGIVLYEMLAGKPPFAGVNSIDTIGSILHQEPPSLNKTAPGIPRELQHIVEKSLRKDPDERYQTARDLLIDLKDLKQELEFQNKLERTATPNQEEAETQILKATTANPLPSTSSAEYVASEIKNHKFAFISGIIILLAAIGFGFWYFNKNLASQSQIDSIAVLPFENASQDPNAEYLSDGISENIINTLSRLPSLRVLPRSTVFRYKSVPIDPQKIGTELNVRAVLTGKIIQRDNTLQIQTELIDVESGAQLWGEQYNRPFTDVLNVQETIAREIATNLHLQLTGTDSQQLSKRYTENTGAYQLYLQGRFFSNKRTLQDLQKAIEYFQQAIALDPNYALAFAGLSEAYSQLSTNGEASHDLMTKSREAALTAISLDERLAEGHSALGAVLHGYDFDFAGAEREFKRAIELNPNYSAVHQQYGRLLSSLGRHEEALAELQRALEIDPLSLPVNRIYGEILLFARKYDQSIAQFKKTIELDPNFPQSYLGLATAYQIKSMPSEAVEEYAKMQDINGNHEIAALMRESFAKGGWQGFLRVLIGEKRLSTLSPTYLAAVCYVELNEKDKAFAELDKAYESREFRLILLKIDPRLDPLRDDPRFRELLRKVGFPE